LHQQFRRAGKQEDLPNRAGQQTEEERDQRQQAAIPEARLWDGEAETQDC
jgi:hypothetical protein